MRIRQFYRQMRIYYRKKQKVMYRKKTIKSMEEGKETSVEGEELYKKR